MKQPPFKVMCIKTPNDPHPSVVGLPTPVIGDTDTVKEVAMYFNREYYALDRFGDDDFFRADHFATLPDQEPSVVNEENFEALIYQR